MIKDIVTAFYHLSEKHRLIRGFKYGNLSKRSGIGNDAYPLCFLESPIYIGDSTLTSGMVTCTINFDIVATPQYLQNLLGKKEISEEFIQSLCYHIALNYVAKLRDDNKNEESDIEVYSFNFVTLNHWKDDDADGMRCTMKIGLRNPINYCDVDEHFDEDKVFDMKSILPDIDTDNANGCVVFSEKSLLPKIEL